MTDEEMAEKYLKEKLEERKDKFIFELPEVYITDVKQAFLAGLKAGRPQWHDLRKDPEDLPIGEVFYWFDENPNLKDGKVYGRSIGYYNPYEKEWHGYYKGCPCRVHNVIAWCEIPTFDKE